MIEAAIRLQIRCKVTEYIASERQVREGSEAYHFVIHKLLTSHSRVLIFHELLPPAFLLSDYTRHFV